NRGTGSPNVTSPAQGTTSTARAFDPPRGQGWATIGAMTSTPAPGIALVTGGATGIGAASCRALAKAGFRVVIHHPARHEPAETLAKEVPGALAVTADLGTEAGVEALAKTVGEQPEPCQVLVNNAGFTVDAPLFTAKATDLDAVFALNVRGTWLLTKR